MGEPATADDPPLRDAEGDIPAFPTTPVDPATGRILPMTEEERRARRAAAIRALAAIHAITDETDTEERWQEIYRGIDAGRPERKLFEGLY